MSDGSNESFTLLLKQMHMYLASWHFMGNMLPVSLLFSWANLNQAFFPTTQTKHLSSPPFSVLIFLDPFTAGNPVDLLAPSENAVHLTSRPLPWFSYLRGSSLLITLGSSRWPIYVGGLSPSCLGDLTVLASDVMHYIFPADILHFTPLRFYKRPNYTSTWSR